MKDDQDNFKDTSFNTSVRGRVPPLITTKCVIRDDGNDQMLSFLNKSNWSVSWKIILF